MKKEKRELSWVYDVILPLFFMIALVLVNFFPESNTSKELINLVPTLTYAMLCMWSLRR